MKKLLISLLVPVVFAASCGQNGTVSSPDPAGYSPEAVLYNDWDRAVRIDVDMQNMYVSTPTKIEKPIDLYMSMALALKYNYTRRLITYEDSIIRAGRSPVNRLHMSLPYSVQCLVPTTETTWRVFRSALPFVKSTSGASIQLFSRDG